MVSSIDGATYNVHVTQRASRDVHPAPDANFTYLAETISALAILISVVRRRASREYQTEGMRDRWRVRWAWETREDSIGKVGKRDVIKP